MRIRDLLTALVFMWLPWTAFAGDGEVSAALTRQMQVNQQRYGIAGQALLVAHNGEVIFRGVSGYANVGTNERMKLDDVFPVYSLSKLFVSTLVMQLVEQGRVDLDQPAARYLAGLPPAWQGITVLQFLNHTSGVPEYFGADHDAVASLAGVVFPASIQAVFASLKEEPLQFQAGTETRYTQTNYLVLSALLEAHYGKPYPRIAAERIIEKLGLKGTWLGAANVPKSRLVQSYIGKDGRLERDPDIAWPDYSFGHASLFLTLDDLARFLRAVRTGELVGKASLQKLWQPQMLASHMRGDFATGWEYGESGAYRQVGHDGGARVRVRMLFKDSLDGDSYTFIYVTNGSAKNVWSRTLIDSAMAVMAPKAFPLETLSEELIGFALQPADAGRATAFANEIRENSPFKGSDLERAINTIGYSVKGNLGIDAAIRIFSLNTQLFPKSANTWDSLAETYKAQGDDARAQSFYEKAKQLSARAGK